LRVGYKGEVRFGSVRIYEGHPPEDEFATFSYVPKYEFEGEIIPECFSATSHIQSDTFNYLLNLVDEQTVLEASLGFDIISSNIKHELYGMDGDKYWDLTNRPEDCPFEVASAIEIRTSKQEDP
jgi:hypothetical protein